MTETEWLACAKPVLLLAYVKARLSQRKLRLFACAVARQSWHLLTDERSRHAIEAAEQYADGEVTSAALESARRRAYFGWGSTRSWHAAHDAWACCLEDVYEGSDLVAYEDNPVPYPTQCTLLRCIAGNPFRPLRATQECARCTGYGLLDVASGRGAVEGRECPRCLGFGVHRADWLTPRVSAVARAIYQERTFADLPILADLCEEEGCPVEEACPVCKGQPLMTQTGYVRGAPDFQRALCVCCQGRSVIPAYLLAHLRCQGPHARGDWLIDLVLGYR